MMKYTKIHFMLVFIFLLPVLSVACMDEAQNSAVSGSQENSSTTQDEGETLTEDDAHSHETQVKPPSPSPGPTDTPNPLPTTSTTPMPPDDDHGSMQSTATDISHIPYFGDRDKFQLSPEAALAYAEAVRTAELDYGQWGYHSFEILYPVLIDVSGDGFPLLLLIEKGEKQSYSIGDYYSLGVDYSQWNMYLQVQNILFGYLDGEVHMIAQSSGIGIAPLHDSALLCLMRESDYGGMYYFHKINYGAAELISSKSFSSHTGEERYYVDEVEVSEEEYRAIRSTISMEYFMTTDHPGNVIVIPTFMEYLPHYFTRDQLMQILREYSSTNIS